MMKRESFPVANIYVPAKRRSALNPKTVRDIAESILQSGQKTPILLRRDGDRFVLVEGLHGSKPARRWARRQSLDIWWMRESIEASTRPPA